MVKDRINGEVEVLVHCMRPDELLEFKMDTIQKDQAFYYLLDENLERKTFRGKPATWKYNKCFINPRKVASSVRFVVKLRLIIWNYINR